MVLTLGAFFPFVSVSSLSHPLLSLLTFNFLPENTEGSSLTSGPGWSLRSKLLNIPSAFRMKSSACLVTSLFLLFVRT